MVYATVEDMVAAFSEQEMTELSNLDYPDNSFVNDEPIVRAIVDAQAQIDSYLCVRYKTPLVVVPNILRNHTCDVARYILDKDNPREEVIRRRDLVFSYLKDLVAGKASLPGIVDGTDGTETNPSNGDVVFVVSPGRIWTRETLKDY